MPSSNPATATEFGPSTSAPAKIGGAPFSEPSWQPSAACNSFSATLGPTAFTSEVVSITALPTRSQGITISLVLNGRFQAVSGQRCSMKEKSRYETHHLDFLAGSLHSASHLGTRLGTRGARKIFAPPRMGHR